MTTPIELPVGQKTWTVSVPPGVTVDLTRAPFAPPAAGPRELVRAALEYPLGMDAPLRRAVTPDDHVAIVLDEGLPHIPELLAGVIEHLQGGGIDPSAVTVVVPPGHGQNPWVDDLPDEFADIHLEVHDTEERQKLAYLATTKAGRRVYLNRTLVEADFVVVLTGRGYDPTYGYAGAEVALFPTLSDAETQAGFVGQFTTDAPGRKPPAVRAEAVEIGWLFGTPFFVQVIEGAGGEVQEVVAGLPDSTAEGVRRQDARWRGTVAERPDLVIATVSGDAERVDFQAVASAAASAARVVRPGGRIAVLTDAAPPFEEGAELLRQAEDPAAVGKVLSKRKPDDWPAAALWAFAAQRASLFLASRWPDEVAEELFATAVKSAGEVQRLIDAAERVLVIPDAHRTMVELAYGTLRVPGFPGRHAERALRGLPMPQPSPLHAVEEAAGATFAEYAGYSLPARYGDPPAEYRAAMTGAALFDYSLAAKLTLAGPDAPQFLHNISTNDIKSLPLGGGCETYLCDARARALFVAWVYHVRLADGRNALWVETTPGRGAVLLKYLDRYLIAEAVELADVTDQFSQMHLAGPRAKEVLEAALADRVPDLAEFQHMERTFGASATCSIRRRDPLGVPGYDVVCLPARAEGVWRMLTAAGATPAGLETYETLRIEAGTPVYGVDVDESRFVMEVGRADRAVSFTKGCFPGQEPIVMARDRAGRVNRSFLGLKALSGGVPPAGAKLLRDGQEVGVVTSGVESPRLGAPLVLGYVHWKHTEPGTRLEAEGGAGRQPVEVIGYPPTDARRPAS